MPRKKIKVSIPERMQAILDNPQLVIELTDEEVQKGKLRDKNGEFRGRPMPVVPTKFYHILRAEQIRRWEIKVAETLQPSLEVLHDISQGKITGRVPADARMKAAIYLIERTVGKVPEKTEMHVEMKPWQDGIEGLLYDPNKEK